MVVLFADLSRRHQSGHLGAEAGVSEKDNYCNSYVVGHKFMLALSIKNLVKKYPSPPFGLRRASSEKVAVNGISFAIEEGELVF